MCLNDLWIFQPSTSTALYISGSQYVHGFGTYPSAYGGLGQPGARQQAATWTDGTGQMWMFGGKGYAAALPVGKKYTICHLYHLHARAHTLNIELSERARKPSQLHINIRTSAHTHLHFSLSADSTTWLGDLWKFSVQDNQWIFVAGDNNYNSRYFSYAHSEMLLLLP